MVQLSRFLFHKSSWRYFCGDAKVLNHYGALTFYNFYALIKLMSYESISPENQKAFLVNAEAEAQAAEARVTRDTDRQVRKHRRSVVAEANRAKTGHVKDVKRGGKELGRWMASVDPVAELMGQVETVRQDTVGDQAERYAHAEQAKLRADAFDRPELYTEEQRARMVHPGPASVVGYHMLKAVSPEARDQVLETYVRDPNSLRPPTDPSTSKL